MAQDYGNEDLSSYEWNTICRMDINIVHISCKQHL